MENEKLIKSETAQLGIPVVGSSLFLSADDENLKKCLRNMVKHTP